MLVLLSAVRSRKIKSSVLMVLIAVFLTACGGGGGGGGGDSAPANNISGTTQPATQPPVTQPPSTVPPTIATQPQSITVEDGQSATFSVSASGTAPLSYQWRLNGVDILGATNSTYSIATTSPANDGAQVTVIISNTAGSVTSNTVMLTVNRVAPTISSQPTGQNVLAGNSATFSVVATGSAPLSFQWYKSGVAIPGAINASYVTPATGLNDNGAVFTAIVSNAAGTISSSSAQLTVTPVVIAPTITSQPYNVTANINESATFSIAISGTQPISFQWFRNGTLITGATDSSYTIASVSLINNGDIYSATATNSAGSSTSTSATLTAINPGQISLFAGDLGGFGNIDGLGSTARFWYPNDLAVDSADNLYVIEYQSWLFGGNRLIRKITPTGVVTTIEESRNKNWIMRGIAVDSAGTINVTEEASGGVFQIHLNGSITYRRPLMMTEPDKIAVDSLGNLIVTSISRGITKISSTGIDSKIGSCCDYVDGTAETAKFRNVLGITTDDAGNSFVTDAGNNAIRKIDSNGSVSTSTTLISGSGLARDSSANLFVIDGHSIKKLSATNVVSTLAGEPTSFDFADGPGISARFRTPSGIVADSAGNIFVADQLNHVIRKIKPDGIVSTFAGKVSSKSPSSWTGIARGLNGTLFVADSNLPGIQKIDATGAISVYSSSVISGSPGYSYAFVNPYGIAVDQSGNVYTVNMGQGSILKTDPQSQVTSVLAEPGGHPFAIAIDANGFIYTSSLDYGVITKRTTSGTYVGLIGDADFNAPRGLACDSAGNVYVADTGNHIIRKIAPDGVTTTIAGVRAQTGFSNGAASSATFNLPWGLTVDSAGNVYVIDMGNSAIRKISASGIVSTLAGTSGLKGVKLGNLPGALNAPYGIVLSQDETKLFVTDENSVLAIVLP